jgi:cyclopropane-fatty-acyl-phospholipid synthase
MNDSMQQPYDYAPVLRGARGHGAKPHDASPTTCADPPRYESLVLDALDRHLTLGPVCFATPAGNRRVGPGDGNEPLTVRVADGDLFRKLLLGGSAGLGEAYVAGDFSVDDGRLPELLAVLSRSGLDRGLHQEPLLAVQRLGMRLGGAFRGRARRGASSAPMGAPHPHVRPAQHPGEGVQAPIATLPGTEPERICERLALESGQRLLHVGCGRGELIVHAAARHGVEAVGITDDRAHYQAALANIAAHGLKGRVKAYYADFTAIEGRFDRVASAGVLEQLPPRRHGRFFKAIAGALHPCGRALIHATVRNGGLPRHDPFIGRHAFPRGLSRLSAITRAVETSGLTLVGVENLAHHCIPAARRQLEAQEETAASLDPARRTETAERRRDYHLAWCVAATLAGRLAVYRLLLANQDPPPR